MRALRLFVTALSIWGVVLAAAAVAEQTGRPALAEVAPVAATTPARPGTEVQVSVQIRLADGLHVNSNRPRDPSLIPLTLTVDAPKGVSLAGVTFPDPVDLRQRGDDVPLSVFEHTFVIGVRLRLAADLAAGSVVVPVRVHYQACDETRCYIPATAETAWTLSVGSSSDAPSPVVAAVVNPLSVLDHFVVANTAGGYLNAREFTAFLGQADTGAVSAKPFAGRGLFTIVLLVLAGGLALNLTPCVLPLIPINLAILGAGAGARSRSRGLLLGSAYGGAMAVVYGGLGVVVIVTSRAFGTINASAWFNVGMAVLFVVLALAMFDVFFIDLSRFSSRVKLAPERGSIALAVSMGGIAALLAGACVAPVVLQVVVFSSDLYASGTHAALGLPFVLGLGMAAPWPFAGAGLAALPKPGAWMVRVKQTFGVAILLLAAYYAQIAYGLFVARPVVDSVRGGGWHSSLVEGLDVAEREHKPVLVDLWATWCKNCFAMDKTTLADPGVNAALAGYVKVKFQAEDPDEESVRSVMQRFGAIGLPAYVVLRPKTEKVAETAPGFSLEDLEGQMTSLEGLRGRIVVVNFWATWCPPCRTEIPELMRLRAAFAPEEVALLGIATDDGGRPVVSRFVRNERFPLGSANRPINYTVLLGTPAVGDAYRVEGLPATILIDRAGHVVERFDAPIHAADLEPRIRQLLSASNGGAATPTQLQQKEIRK
jgi:thiol:disulfide interchange protein